MERLPLRYGRLRPQLARSMPAAAILYWGDFFHSRDYLNRVAALLCQIGDAATPAEALADVHRHFYLRDAPARARRDGCFPWSKFGPLRQTPARPARHHGAPISR